MKNIQSQFMSIITKYSGYVSVLIQNMRLVLLIAFSVMAGYLVFRVDSLLNQEIPQLSSDNKPITDKKPDVEVLSVFNELSVQNVEVGSQFQTNRDNPF